MSTWKKVLLALGLIAAVTLTALGGYGSREWITLNNFVQIFAGGFFLGVTAIGAIRARSCVPPPPPPPTTIIPKSGA